MEFAQTQVKISNELRLYTDVRRNADLSALSFLGSSLMPCDDIKLSNMPNMELFYYFKSVSAGENGDVKCYNFSETASAANYFV